MRIIHRNKRVQRLKTRIASWKTSQVFTSAVEETIQRERLYSIKIPSLSCEEEDVDSLLSQKQPAIHLYALARYKQTVLVPIFSIMSEVLN